MKRIFEIEFPDELGEMWMNQDNLMLCINAYCENKDGKIKSSDVTGKVVYLSEDQSLPDAPSRGYPVHIDWRDGQNAAVKAGWRKVLLT